MTTKRPLCGSTLNGGSRLSSLVCFFLIFLLHCGGSNRNIVFPSGVAAGSVTMQSAVFWTRVEGAPSTQLELSLEEDFGVLASRIAQVPVENGIAKADVGGFLPDTRYFYRFRSGNTTSETGSFRTAPPENAIQGFSFAFSGDSNAVFKPFTVLGTVRGDEPDFFIYLGDTIYSDDSRNPLAPAYTEMEYDAFYQENREDTHLRNLLAATSVFAMWDDHEVTNDYSGQTVDQQQMQNGLSSFFRNFPVREQPGEPLRLYHRFRWGRAAEFFVLDERQYRSGEIICENAEGNVLLLADAPCLDRLWEPGRTFLGQEQKQWLRDSLAASSATFKFIVGQLPITEFRILPYDRWEGYPQERREILDFIIDSNIPNVYFLSTDIHANFVTTVEGDLHEFITGPIATDTLQTATQWVDLTINPDLFFTLFFRNVVEFHEIDRFAYTLVTVNPDTSPPTFLVEIKDSLGEVLYSGTFTAEE